MSSSTTLLLLLLTTAAAAAAAAAAATTATTAATAAVVGEVVGAAVVGEGGDALCSGNQEDYRGRVFVTKSGIPCQNWKSQEPHTVRHVPDDAADDEDGHNFCRNPDGHSSAWCYTTDASKRWEECDVQCQPRNEAGSGAVDCNVDVCDNGGVCEAGRCHCVRGFAGRLCQVMLGTCAATQSKCLGRSRCVDKKHDAFGEVHECQCPENRSGPRCEASELCEGDNDEDYRGRVQKTKSGLRCQRWDADSPHSHRFSKGDFADLDIAGHNFCRNPDGHTSAWCYTSSSMQRWGECDVRCRRKQHCTVSDWIKYGECSSPCRNMGVLMYYRTVIQSAENGGDTCPSLTKSETCGEFPCHGGYLYDKCTEVGGTMTTSNCKHNATHPCGVGHRIVTCTYEENGETMQFSDTLRCRTACKVNPEWVPTQPPPVSCLVDGDSNWSPCSVKCGLGLQTRTRNVIRPQLFGGQPCPSTKFSRVCQVRDCNKPVPPKFLEMDVSVSGGTSISKKKKDKKKNKKNKKKSSKKKSRRNKKRSSENGGIARPPQPPLGHSSGGSSSSSGGSSGGSNTDLNVIINDNNNGDDDGIVSNRNNDVNNNNNKNSNNEYMGGDHDELEADPHDAKAQRRVCSGPSRRLGTVVHGPMWIRRRRNVLKRRDVLGCNQVTLSFFFQLVKRHRSPSNIVSLGKVRWGTSTIGKKQSDPPMLRVNVEKNSTRWFVAFDQGPRCIAPAGKELKVGRWSHFSIRRSRSRLSVWYNGKKVCERSYKPTRSFRKALSLGVDTPAIGRIMDLRYAGLWMSDEQLSDMAKLRNARGRQSLISLESVVRLGTHDKKCVLVKSGNSTEYDHVVRGPCSSPRALWRMRVHGPRLYSFKSKATNAHLQGWTNGQLVAQGSRVNSRHLFRAADPIANEDSIPFARRECFRDQELHSALPYQFSHKEMDVVSCVDQCAALKFSAAGLFNGRVCKCGSADLFSSHSDRISESYFELPASECETPCVGDFRQKCGGGDKLQATQLYTRTLFEAEPGDEKVKYVYEETGEDGKTTRHVVRSPNPDGWAGWQALFSVRTRSYVRAEPNTVMFRVDQRYLSYSTRLQIQPVTNPTTTTTTTSFL